jgi:hypothetical protein
MLALERDAPAVGRLQLRIENYLSFTTGFTGQELAGAALQLRFAPNMIAATIGRCKPDKPACAYPHSHAYGLLGCCPHQGSRGIESSGADDPRVNGPGST